MIICKNAKLKILDAASELFYIYGISGTGIVPITKKAKVAKMSLYNNYVSKSELINDYLEKNSKEWLDLYQNKVKLAKTPIEGIISIFLTYEEIFNQKYKKNFKGCCLINAAVEFETGSQEREKIRKHKKFIEDLITKYLTEIYDNPEIIDRKSLHLSFLLEGALVNAGLNNDMGIIKNAREMVNEILDIS
ncbi:MULTISPECIES: TetR/AcrR family transcriptional regulator [Acinetobacter calcoaceticus/baumannii complex]|uniref:TetR/AcrR family transcriptional regulator n=1 Tax=Acinetobacter calcoaceticus/baumannii complex TaxID=909768 RepID=UPI000BF8E76B|nr:TetR/AcrR family transcriptional regulator [Acinetobacter baumannii]